MSWLCDSLWGSKNDNYGWWKHGTLQSLKKVYYGQRRVHNLQQYVFSADYTGLLKIFWKMRNYKFFNYWQYDLYLSVYFCDDKVT